MLEKIEQISRSRWAPWIIFFVGVAFRVVGALVGGIHSDDGDRTYTDMTNAFLAGNGFTLVREYGRLYSWLPPGMSILNVPFFVLFGSHAFHVERVFFILMSSAANVSLFYVGIRLFSRPTAWLAAVLWAVYPPQWFWSTRVNPQPWATNIMIFCLLLLFQTWEKKQGWKAFLVGLLWVTAALSRGEYLLGVIVFILVTFFFAPDPSSRIKLSLLILTGYMIGFSPWVVRNYKIHHRFLPISTNYGDSFWKAYNPQYEFKGEDIPFPEELHERLMKIPSEVGRADLLKAEALAYMKAHPGRTAYIIVGNALNFWRPWLARSAVSSLQRGVYLVSWLPVFTLFLIGLFCVPWRNPAWLAVTGLLLYKFGIHIFFYVIVRYREAAFPLIALIAMLPIERWYFSRKSKETYA